MLTTRAARLTATRPQSVAFPSSLHSARRCADPPGTGPLSRPCSTTEAVHGSDRWRSDCRSSLGRSRLIKGSIRRSVSESRSRRRRGSFQMWGRGAWTRCRPLGHRDRCRGRYLPQIFALRVGGACRRGFTLDRFPVPKGGCPMSKILARLGVVNNRAGGSSTKDK